MARSRRRLGRRLWVQSGSFVLLVGGLALRHSWLADPSDELEETRFWRQLQSVNATNTTSSSDDNDDCPHKVGWSLAVVWILIVLYMFLGIAIVCDELFVPALEVIAEKLKLSDDVSGATLMAAGGSAPELATSLIGTFSRSAVGFGTIVGSAVFNVLFVIAMCALFTPTHLAPLQLTWWPLARDCSYYVMTLACLGVWFAVTSPQRVVFWEAAVQFSLYLGYVLLMSKNAELEAFVKGVKCDEVELCETRSTDRCVAEQKSTSSFGRTSSSEDKRSMTSKKRPLAFRAGIGRLLLGDFSSAQLTGMSVVTQISGDVDSTFAQIDRDHRGYLDVKDLQRLLEELGQDPTAVEIEQLTKVLDSNGDGRIDRTEFKVWYIQSEARLKSEVRRVFDLFDANRDGCVDRGEIESVLQALSAHISKEQARQALSTFPVTASPQGVTFDEFQAWYRQTMFWARHKNEAASAAKPLLGIVLDAMTKVATCGPSGDENDDENDDDREDPRPKDDDDDSISLLSRLGVLLALPLNLLLAITVPDCRVPGRENQCYATFLLSIAWIGALSFTMVHGIERIGAQFGVPEFLMGLIFLAAGTSVPDLLSSVVVAKQGKGDMAVSSSIGSNIFDVTVGLPLPWLLFALFEWDNVKVTGSVAISIAILLVMVLLVIGAIASSGWKMSLRLGAFMFLLYILYIVQEILRTNFGKC